MKLCLQEILNYLELLVNSANVIRKDVSLCVKHVRLSQ